MTGREGETGYEPTPVAMGNGYRNRPPHCKEVKRKLWEVGMVTVVFTTKYSVEDVNFDL